MGYPFGGSSAVAQEPTPRQIRRANAATTKLFRLISTTPFGTKMVVA